MRQAKKLRTDRAVHWGLGIGAIMIIVALAWSEFSERRAPRNGHPAIPQKWEFTTAGTITGSLALSDDGTLYAASADGFVYALDSSGKLQWKLQLAPIESSPAIGADGTIYITDANELIYAINRNGTQQWSFGGGPYADKRLGSIAAAVDQNFLYTPWRGQVRALRLSTGYPEWPAGMDFERGGAVILLPNSLILHPGNGRLEAVESGGRTAWEYPVRNPPLTPDLLLKYGGQPPAGNFWLESAMAVGADGTLYACAADSRLVALGSNGAFKWEFHTKSASVSRAAPVIASDGSIYTGTSEGLLYALNSDGSQKWSAAISGSISSTPVLAEDGTIFVVSGSTLDAVSPDGHIIAQAPLMAAAQSSPTLAPDGTVYVATTAGKVLAFDGGHGSLMDSPWPKFQRDLANSGRAILY